jgi:hypothetical protein
VVKVLSYLFLSADVIECLDAADVQDDGLINISDAIYVLSYLFRSGSEPTSPWKECDIDPTPDQLSCSQGQRSCD